MANVLLVYPQFPPSYWSCKYALQFTGRRAAVPPLGLLTIAAAFPSSYQLKLVDLNIESLQEEDLEWADIACVSAMLIQRRSMEDLVSRCALKGVRVIAGGPYPTSCADQIRNVDHLVLGEAEELLPVLINELEMGRAKPVYKLTSSQGVEPRRPDLSTAPRPRYDLLDMQAYHSMALQYSRGCPFNCEFCDITQLFGRIPRTKGAQQMLAEFQLLYDLGWKGPVFLVDDNFIGNRKQLSEFLRALRQWQEEHRYPFSLFTEASVNLSQHPDLMEGMRAAGFNMVFLGIETPNANALIATGKKQNVRRSENEFLLNAVRTIQRSGLEVTAGFILGLDGDDEEGFRAQIEFPQRAGIPGAMVGLLTALPGTDLYRRLEREGRLCGQSEGNNVDCVLNFTPQMDRDKLIEGYRTVLGTLYQRSLRSYFQRCLTLFRHWRPANLNRQPISGRDIRAFLLSLARQAFSWHGAQYLAFLSKVLLKYPRFFREAVRLAILGYHYQRVTREQLKIHEFNAFLARERRYAEELIARIGRARDLTSAEIIQQLQELCGRVQKRYRKINRDFRGGVQEGVQSFYLTIERAQAPGRRNVSF